MRVKKSNKKRLFKIILSILAPIIIFSIINIALGFIKTGNAEFFYSNFFVVFIIAAIVGYTFTAFFNILFLNNYLIDKEVTWFYIALISFVYLKVISLPVKILVAWTNRTQIDFLELISLAPIELLYLFILVQVYVYLKSKEKIRREIKISSKS